MHARKQAILTRSDPIPSLRLGIDTSKRKKCQRSIRQPTSQPAAAQAQRLSTSTSQLRGPSPGTAHTAGRASQVHHTPTRPVHLRAAPHHSLPSTVSSLLVLPLAHTSCGCCCSVAGYQLRGPSPWVECSCSPSDRECITAAPSSPCQAGWVLFIGCYSLESMKRASTL
eukprot:COSAG05_NODE_56_length_23335_cov_15.221338_18_plen_169_part_00